MRSQKGLNNPIDLDDPPLFNYPIDYVIRTWLDHDRHGTYPDVGGYNDQDPLLMDDWHTMNLYHIRVENDIVSTVSMPTENAVSDIDELMGG